MTIYLASKTRMAPVWRHLRARGLPIVATWIDEPDPCPDYEGLWSRYISEAAAADFTILYAEEGDVFKGALIECGAALAAGKTVIQVGEGPSLLAGDGSDASFTHHERWLRAETIMDAIAYATRGASVPA